MEKDLQYYFDNYDKLNRNDFRTFMKLIGDIVQRRLNINTKITYILDDLKDYSGYCAPRFNESEDGQYILPLATNGMIIKIDSKIEDSFIKLKNDNIKLSNGKEIPIRQNILLLLAQVVSHEVRHAYQNEQLLRDSVENPEAILWLKEELIRIFFFTSHNDRFYNDNYQSIFTEQDAYNYQGIMPLVLLNKYLKLDLDTKKLYIEREKELGNFSCKEKNMFAEFKDLDDESKFKIGTSYIIELFNKIVKNLPPEYIKNSMLKYEYNPDGSKKTYMQLMKDKEEHKKNGEYLDYLYDFIIKCDYNLQIQKYSLELNNQDISIGDKKNIITDLNNLYEKFLLNYEVVHLLYSEKIHKIESRLKQLAIDLNMSLVDKAKEESTLHKELAMYKNIEKQLLSNVKKYQEEQQIFKEQQDIYFANLSLIDEYKKDNGIIDVIENGVIVDKHNYSDDIIFLNRNLSLVGLKNYRYLYSKYVRNAINNVHFNTNNEETFEEDLELVNLLLSKKERMNDNQINKLNIIKKIIESNIKLKKLYNVELDDNQIKK